jgi:hypothetical protein
LWRKYGEKVDFADRFVKVIEIIGKMVLIECGQLLMVI